MEGNRAVINQAATIRAIRDIGNGFIALSRALEGNGEAKSPDRVASDQDEAAAAVASFLCPVCHGPMTLRAARATGEFFAGCRKYPACKGTRNLDGVPSNTKPKPPVEADPDNT